MSERAQKVRTRSSSKALSSVPAYDERWRMDAETSRVIIHRRAYVVPQPVLTHLDGMGRKLWDYESRLEGLSTDSGQAGAKTTGCATPSRHGNVELQAWRALSRQFLNTENVDDAQTEIIELQAYGAHADRRASCSRLELDQAKDAIRKTAIAIRDGERALQMLKDVAQCLEDSLKTLSAFRTPHV